jgi:multicomponent K+:H+ antiporter subunit E
MNTPSPDHAATPPKGRRRLLPHPGLSLFMWALWLLLINQASVGHLLLGALLAWLIPYLTQEFWPEATVMHKPLVAVRFVLVVLWDIVVANVILAVRILGPIDKLRPAFMTMPLDLEQDFAITLLASTISLTPGTVSADLSNDRKTLLIHSLHVDDVEAAVREMKTRYEDPLKEIFACSAPSP